MLLHKAHAKSALASRLCAVVDLQIGLAQWYTTMMQPDARMALRLVLGPNLFIQLAGLRKRRRVVIS
jgi:hypothetical protein